MKGILGLLIACMLGAMGVFFNWMYLNSALKGTETESFIGVGKPIKAGEIITKDRLVELKVPKSQAGQMGRFIAKWSIVDTIDGKQPATRDFAVNGPDLILTWDLRDLPSKVKAADDEELVFVTINTPNFVSELVDPGDELTFNFPNDVAGQPKSVVTNGGGTPQPEGPVTIVGPFRVATIGSRTGSYKVYRSKNLPMGQSRQLGLLAKREGKGYDAKMTQLLGLLGNRRDYSVSVDKADKQE